MLFASFECVREKRMRELSHDSHRLSQYMAMYMCVFVIRFFSSSSRKMVIKRFQLEVVVEGGKVCSTYREKKNREHKTLREWVRPTFHIKVIKNDGEKSILQLFFPPFPFLLHHPFYIFSQHINIYLFTASRHSIQFQSHHTYKFIFAHTMVVNFRILLILNRRQQCSESFFFLFCLSINQRGLTIFFTHIWSLIY